MKTIQFRKRMVLIVILALAAARGSGGDGTSSPTPTLTGDISTPGTPAGTPATPTSTTASVISVSVSPETPSAGVQAIFSVNGNNLQSGYTFALPGCVAKESDSASSAERQFACTLTLAGTDLPGSVISPDGTVLAHFAQTVNGDGPLQSQRLSGNHQHTCALTAAGGVKCWGNNAAGQLGDGTREGRLTPVNVVGLSAGVIAVSTGLSHTCALTSAGGVTCWGFNGISGQLGDGTSQDRLTPTNVIGLGSGIVSIAVGYFHACALTAIGGVKCWGSNTYGQLGNGTTQTPDRYTAVDVAGLSGVVALSAGDAHTCAVTRYGGVKCWGENSAGQLGDGTTQRRLTPVDVAGLDSRVMMVSAGSAYTCAVTTAGAAKCWGDNREGNLGNDTRQARQQTPVDVFGLDSGVLQIAAGASSTCALSTSGALKCWGLNIFGRLGDGTTQSRLTPVDVIGLSNGAVAVSTGYAHACALTNAPGLKCWGASGELGAGMLSVINQPVPLDIAGL